MVSDNELRAEVGTPLPFVFVNVKVTVGLLPDVPLEIFFSNWLRKHYKIKSILHRLFIL